jgi:retron-type reverse transcriptase
LTTSLIQKICTLRSSDCSIKAVKRLYETATTEHRAKLWLMQLNHVTDAAHLIELALEGATKGWKCEWVPRWKNVGGSVQQRARALVLISRNDLHQLRQLRRLFTEEVISEALLWVSKQLPSASSFEIIFLELTSCLGLRHGANIRWLLSIRNCEKPSGAKFDYLYAKHEIPKKSGKMRLISAPNPALKRIQKSIAVNLLDPLGAHDAAYGFVIGRSIVGNASLHVGKPLVVNADVSNCFPSVRWPLVKAALIRDLSDRLNPLSISFLVDLCTAEGVLPVGAPTSPAILNRVLFKTDQILGQQAAMRGCSYSRYADDITFSGDEKAVALLGVARGVLGRIGLELDPQKTNIFRRGRRQMCTGLVVNDRVNVPRSIRKKIRAAVHAFEQGRSLVWEGELMSPSSLRGRLEFLKMVAPDTTAPLVQRLDAAQSVKSKKKKGKSNGSSKTGRA